MAASFLLGFSADLSQVGLKRPLGNPGRAGAEKRAEKQMSVAA
jgi:hypothetical protein